MGTTLRLLWCGLLLGLGLGLSTPAWPRPRMHNFADVPCGTYGNRQSRIVGGMAASPGEFPWLVSITRRGGHFCGGTLISRRWVLTAAHCMCSGTVQLPLTHVRVTVGAHHLQRTEAPSANQVAVHKLVQHPLYRCSHYVHDIALLQLQEDVLWSEVVRPACLPTEPATHGYSDYADREATAAGWGWTAESSSTSSSSSSSSSGIGGRADVPHKVTVQVVDNAKCQAWYKSQEKKVKILNSQMCAGYEEGGRDSCWADSGGPLMIVDDQQVTVVGVISTGIGCGRYRLPGVYTRLSDYVLWIRSVLEA